MKTEFKDISHGEDDKGKTFDHHCVLEVKTTDDDGNVTETKEQGYMIQGKDCIYLNAPKIYPPQDTDLMNGQYVPLMTDAQDIVGAINEVFCLGSGDDWQPPEMPEPEAYEIYLLVEVVDLISPKLEIRISRPEDAVAGYGPMTVDWGDGTADEWTTDSIPIPDYPDYYKWSTLSHNYAAVGRYLIKISATEHSCFLQKITPTGNMPYSKVLCAKLGSEIQ